MAVSALALLQACTGAQFDSIPQAVGGLPQDAPQRPMEAPAFPPVHDMPPARPAAVLDAEQQKRLQDDLNAIRNRQPNQEKNKAKDKKRAEEEAKAKEEGKTKIKDKAKKPAKGQAAKKPAAGQAPAGTETAGASRNP